MPVMMSSKRLEAPQRPMGGGLQNSREPVRAQGEDRTEPAPQRAVAAAPAGVAQALPAATQADKNARNLQRAHHQQAAQRAASAALKASKPAAELLRGVDGALAHLLDPISTSCLGPIQLGGVRAIWAEFHGEPTEVEPSMQTQPLGPYTVGEAHEQGRRPSMEDASVVRWFDAECIGIVGLFDGHGGVTRSAYAAQMVPDVFVQHLARLSPDDRLSYPAVAAALKNAMAAPDRAQRRDGSTKPRPQLDTVHQKMKAIPKQLRTLAHEESCAAKAEHRQANKTIVNAAHTEADAGSTALVAVFLEKSLYIANLGDSRALLVDAEGQAQRLSVDHKPEDERRKIEARGGRVVHHSGTARVDGILATARALGDLRKHVGRRPQITRIEVEPQGTAQRYLLLACDGIYDVLHDDVLASFIAKAAQSGRSPADIAADLVRAAHARGSGDNLSAMLVPLGA